MRIKATGKDGERKELLKRQVKGADLQQVDLKDWIATQRLDGQRSPKTG